MIANDRQTLERSGIQFAYDADANALVYAGTVVSLAAGYATSGVANVAHVVIGVAVETVSNVGGIAGAKVVPVKTGTFLLKNSTATDEILRANIGAVCYLVDNETVARTNATNTRPAVGRIRAVSAEGVWVTII